MRDASAGSKQPGTVVERQKKPKWCSVIMATVVGGISARWQGKEAEFLCKAQVLPKSEHNDLIQIHFRWTGWFSPSSAGAILKAQRLVRNTCIPSWGFRTRIV